MIGQRHIVAPDVKLPFTQTQDATQHISRVNSDSHVNIETCRFPDESKSATSMRVKSK